MAADCKVVISIFGEMQSTSITPSVHSEVWQDSGFVGSYEECEGWIVGNAEAQLLRNCEDGSYQTVAPDWPLAPPWERVVIGTAHACAEVFDPGNVYRALVGGGYMDGPADGVVTPYVDLTGRDGHQGGGALG